MMRNWNSKFMQEGFEPSNFCIGISKSFIFRFNARASNNSMFATAPRDYVRTQEYAIAPGGSSVITTTYLVAIGEGLKNHRLRFLKLQAIMDCLLEITHKSFYKLPIKNSWHLHELESLLIVKLMLGPSGHVTHKYWRALTVLPYRSDHQRKIHSKADRLVAVDMGD
jgi:hypothetical protein